MIVTLRLAFTFAVIAAHRSYFVSKLALTKKTE